MNLKYYFYELWSLFVDHGLPLIALLLIGILIPRIGRLAIRIMEHLSLIHISEPTRQVR